jgi:uncharacterized membrane protein YebE (DUF533 family)
VSLGLLKPQSAAERQQLEQYSEIVLKAMINAAKADGQIDQGEIQRIVGKLQESGIGKEVQDYVLTEMTKPLDIQALIAAAKGQIRARRNFLFSLPATSAQSPKEIPRSRAVSTVSHSSGTVFIRLMLAASGT